LVYDFDMNLPVKSYPSGGFSKPKLPDPKSATKGLKFKLNFRNSTVATPENGRATIRATPDGTGLLPGQKEYVPGVTIGPPPPSTYNEWTNVRIADGSILLRSDSISAPGKISITAVYKLRLFSAAKVLGAFDLPTVTADENFGDFTMNDARDYRVPADKGDTVVLNITPQAKETSVTSENGSDFEKAISAKVGGGIDKVISLEVTGEQKSTTSEKTAKTISVTFLTGLLDVEQEGYPKTP
jgi:hypothetical protein